MKRINLLFLMMLIIAGGFSLAGDVGEPHSILAGDVGEPHSIIDTVSV